MEIQYIYLLFTLVAFLYASVGHGGASGYIALMTLLAYPQEEIKSNALFLNLFVSLIAFSQFYKKDDFPFRMFFLLIVVSVPMAFLGGMWSLDDKIFKLILGVVLLVPVAKFLGLFASLRFNVQYNTGLIIIFGLVIGLLSGLLGIGGGILLSPVLILLGWCTVRQTAAISAAFIFVNSFSGILGMSMKNLQLSENIVPVLGFTIAGGLLGGYFGAKIFKTKWIEYILALVLLIACFKLFTT